MTVIFHNRTQDLPLQFLISRLYLCSSQAASARRLISSKLGINKNIKDRKTNTRLRKIAQQGNKSVVQFVGSFV
jgi:hypothetical protein